MKRKFIILPALVMLSAVLLAGDKAGERITWQVLSAGGTVRGHTADFKLTSTVAQTAVSRGHSADFKISHGFLQNIIGEPYICGDVNDDDIVNILDIIYYTGWKFKGGPAPKISAAADVNADDWCNILDIIYLIGYKFKGGPEPHCR